MVEPSPPQNTPKHFHPPPARQRHKHPRRGRGQVFHNATQTGAHTPGSRSPVFGTKSAPLPSPPHSPARREATLPGPPEPTHPAAVLAPPAPPPPVTGP